MCKKFICLASQISLIVGILALKLVACDTFFDHFNREKRIRTLGSFSPLDPRTFVYCMFIIGATFANV